MIDPAAAFTSRLGDANRLAAVPLHPTRDVPGLLPDPRNPDGPRYWLGDPPRTSLLSRILKRLRP